MKNQFKPNCVYSVVAAVLVSGGLSAHAASQTWSATPVDNSWTNVANWSGLAVPGGSNTTTTTDTATFNSAIPGSGIGGASDPITNGFDSGISSILFDTANCGAYVFGHSFSDYPLQVLHNGNITINPAVVNPIVFNEALQFRGPSSQNYVYRITNNAASPLATIYIPAITNLANSTTRPWNLNLAGVNTGTNTIGRLDSENDFEGAICLDVWGGRWIFSAPNDYTDWSNKVSAGVTAYVHIHGGTLEARDPQCFGIVTVGNFTVSNSILQIDNVTLTNNGITLQQGGEILMNGNGTNTEIAVPALSVSATLATASSGSIMTLSNVVGGISSSVLNIAGPGTVLLNGPSTFAGGWSVDSGSFQLSGSTYLPAGGSLAIAAGGQFDVSPLGAVSYTVSFTAFTASGTGTTVGSTAASLNAAAGGTVVINSGISLNFAPTSFTGDSAHPALYIPQGTLSIGGNTFTVNNTSGTPLGAGTYLLAQQASGNITSGGNYAVTVTGSGLAAGGVGTIQVTGGSVNLVVTVYVPQNLTWQGGNPNDNWDVNATPNWFNGAASSVFNDSDNVTFNSAGASNPLVSIVGAVAPGSVVVDTTAANYTFSGTEGIVGNTSVNKMGTGTLVISNPNNGYLGMTVISNGTVQAGINNAFSGTSDVTVSNAALLDLNTYSNNIGALNGGGTVDTVAGGTASLMVGNNNHSGTFNGTIQNTSGTLSLIKGGTGTETLASSNSYSGTTAINNGTLRAANQNALGASAVTVNAGALDLATSLSVASIAGNGTVVNNSTATTNELTILGTSTFNGSIADGSGIVSVLVSGGTLEFTAPSTYSGGTYVASGATLALGNQTPAAQAGTGTIIASNNATISLPGTASATAVLGNSIDTVDNSEVSFTAVVTANAFSGQFLGGITATDLFYGGSMTVSGSMSFSNFLGTVIVTNGEVRGFNALQGGDNTAFDFMGGGGWFVRDANDTVHFGSLTGDETAVISAPSVTAPGIYMIGGANVNSTYSGTISGSNNIIKIGTATLTLNGGGIYGTNTVTDPNTGFQETVVGYGTNDLTYNGTTTISNGVLALDAPSVLTSSPVITLAAPSAVLDASDLGYISNLTVPLENGATQEIVVVGSFEVVTNQTLAGIGTLNGFVQADQGSIFNVGLPTGVFNVTSNATLAGSVIMNLDDTNAAACSTLVAPAFTISNTATLLVTNVGPGLTNGVKFTLFNHPVAGFASMTLPATDPTGTATYLWQNTLSSDGSITLTNGGLVIGPSLPPHITFSVSGNNVTLSWPPSYLGEILQAQTNAVTKGLSTNWVNVTGSGSVTNMTFGINPANGTVFYRLAP
ncbi:MAG TPA: autotransporter-associated beta strand repeat-containing protein [Verrucomicrobiae bacterium]|nr:autotransporter-associated beta strand repeat-containing protein [Verrucomicrobiae bacterium]